MSASLRIPVLKTLSRVVNIPKTNLQALPAMTPSFPQRSYPSLAQMSLPLNQAQKFNRNYLDAFGSNGCKICGLVSGSCEECHGDKMRARMENSEMREVIYIITEVSPKAGKSFGHYP